MAVKNRGNTEDQQGDLELGKRLEQRRSFLPDELSLEVKEKILLEGWFAVQRARARNKGVPEREIAKVVDAAVKRVRSGQ